MSTFGIFYQYFYILILTFSSLTINYFLLEMALFKENKWRSTTLIFGSAWFLFMSEAGFAGLLSLTIGISPSILFRIILFGLASFVLFKNRNSKILKKITKIRFVYLRKKLTLALLVLVLTSIIILIMQTMNTARPQGYFTLIGTLHSGKFIFISDYIRQCNAIPILQSAWSQSIFVGLLGSSTEVSSALLLYVSLCFSIMAFALFMIGFFSYFFEKANHKIGHKYYLASLLIICGNFSLSLAWVLVNDSGNPILFTGYSDIIFGLFFLLFSFLILSKYEEINLKIVSILLIFLVVNSLIASPQILLLLIPSLTILIIYRYRTNFSPLMYFIFVFISSLLVWGGKTGMLLIQTSKASENFPAIGKLVTTNFFDLFHYENISPGIPYVLGDTMDNMSEIYPQVIASAKLAVQDRHSPDRFIWHIEQIVISMLRPIFWPVIGLSFLGFYLYHKRNSKLYKIEDGNSSFIKLTNFWIFSITCFIFGISLAFLFGIPGHKWEMARFSFPCLVLGLICLVLFLEEKNLATVRKKYYLTTVILLLFPTVLHVTTTIVNITNRPEFIRTVPTEYGTMGLFEKPLSMPCANFESK